MLGKALMRQWTGDEVTGLGSSDADIRSPDQVDKAVSESNPEWIVLSAAYTDVDGCEINPTLASAVNTQGAVNVAKAASNCRANLLFVSTDYVFDGKKTVPYESVDPRNPINAYGKSKADAEEKILSLAPNACIVRTSWLFGPGGKCFPDTILKLAASRPEVEVVNDQHGCPTYTFDLADAIIKLCRAGAKGIVHCTNRGVCSWYEFASEIVREAGSKTLIRPTTSERFVRPAPRPKYSVLSDASLSKYGITMRNWQETLPDYLRERATV
ncbi:MAG: dTDP-4-dehydrorhamnose reductase [Acidobacteriaceae bacterium]|nr:dTDP-4-dehydrorhamnose reductase [Acidobacteriaceae bacterium]